jgi:hypothetical protein
MRGSCGGIYLLGGAPLRQPQDGQNDEHDQADDDQQSQRELRQHSSSYAHAPVHPLSKVR